MCCRFVVFILLLLSYLSTKAQEIMTMDGFVNLFIENSVRSKFLAIQKEKNNILLSIENQAFLPRLTFSISGPSYSNSISPITQPNGTLKYIDVNSLTTSSVLSASYPILISGGNVSLNSNFANSEYRNGSSITNSIAFNPYRISMTQPLTFFSPLRWKKKILESEYIRLSLIERENICKYKTELRRVFFDLALLKLRKELVENKQTTLRSVEIRIRELCRLGRMHELELERVQLRIQELDIDILALENDFREFIASLNYQLQNRTISYDCHFIVPEFIQSELEVQSLMEKIDSKSSQLFESKFLNLHFKQADFKANKWLSASIYMGTGLNFNSSHIEDLFKKRSIEYNLGINISITVSDWFFKEREATLLRIESESLNLEFIENLEKQRSQILKLYNQLKLSSQRYYFFLHSEAFTLKESSLKLDLYFLNRIFYSDFENALNAELDNKLKKSEAIARYYIGLSKIEELINN